MRLLALSLPIVYSLCLSTASAYSSISEGVLQAFINSPLELVPADTASTSQINLLNWKVNPQDPPPPPEKYNRLHHFGEWITVSQNSGDCLDTRNRVLQRDSSTPSELRPNNPCKIGTGSWYDPYTNSVFNNSTEVQIDHMVPLKDSYTNGAWKWTYQMRCTYANYMGFRDHLKTVSGPENMFKSDNSPAEYMPPNTAYKCEYLKNWLTIKLIWKLGMQREEAEKIKALVSENGCDTKKFVFSTQSLREQRDFIQQSMAVCPLEPQPSHY